VTGISTDLSIVTTVNKNIILYLLASDPTNWAWAKELPIQSHTLASMNIRPDRVTAALLYNNMKLFVMNMADGSVAYYHAETGSPLDCVAYTCRALYMSSSLLQVMGTSTSTPTKSLAWNNFNPSSGSMAGTYQYLSASPTILSTKIVIWDPLISIWGHKQVLAAQSFACRRIWAH